jgi:hypothetical protein
MKMTAYIDQLPYAEKLATLTQLYLELSLPLENALRAAEADLCHIYRQIMLLWPIAATSSDNEDGNWDKKWPFSKKLFQIET